MTNEFRLIGLNRPWKAAGFNSVYATVEKGIEDWFHCAFDPQEFSDERLDALFRMFKDSEENLWSGKIHKVVVELSEKPIIKELLLDSLYEPAEVRK